MSFDQGRTSRKSPSEETLTPPIQTNRVLFRVSPQPPQFYARILRPHLGGPAPSLSWNGIEKEQCGSKYPVRTRAHKSQSMASACRFYRRWAPRSRTLTFGVEYYRNDRALRIPR